MCLQNVSLSLTEKRNGEFIGLGYKLMIPSEIPKMKVWHQATHKYGKSWNNKLIQANDSELYRVGFHIFTKESDARNYTNYKRGSNLYRVEFKNITAFGTNEVYGLGSGYFGSCVIAQKIRYVEILEEFK